MDPLKERLHALGDEMARASDAASRAEQTIADVRLRLRNRSAERASPWHRLAWLGGVVVAASVLSVGGWTVWRSQADAPLTFTVEAQDEVTGRAVHTGELETRRLSFSDGTTVSLQPQSRLEVHTLTPAGATVGLLNGRARASVERDRKAEWHFLAGPFFVRVTGTEFDLAWDAQARVFELALHEGSVELTGPNLAAARRVRQGEYVRIVLPTDGPEASRLPPEGAQPEHKPPAVSGASDSGASVLPGPDARGGSQAATWQEHLRGGRRTAAFAALDELGPTALDRAGAPDLWTLAHAARLGGRPELAERALLSLRNRHGARGQTAFLLGKVAADQLGAGPGAIKWFQTYLAEEPRGPLAEQALGRLIELQAGTRAGKRAAKEYLARYPSGGYASFARSLLR